MDYGQKLMTRKTKYHGSVKQNTMVVKENERLLLFKFIEHTSNFLHLNKKFWNLF